jgi:hypothetical protein
MRSVAPMGASRPDLSLGTQVAFFTALWVLTSTSNSYVSLEITSLVPVRSVALMGASRPSLSLDTQGYLPIGVPTCPELSNRSRAVCLLHAHKKPVLSPFSDGRRPSR